MMLADEELKKLEETRKELLDKAIELRNKLSENQKSSGTNKIPINRDEYVLLIYKNFVNDLFKDTEGTKHKKKIFLNKPRQYLRKKTCQNDISKTGNYFCTSFRNSILLTSNLFIKILNYLTSTISIIFIY